MSNVTLLPLARWPGADPEIIAGELFEVEFLDDRAAILRRHATRLGTQMAKIGIARLDRRAALDGWYERVFESENRLYANAQGRDAR